MPTPFTLSLSGSYKPCLVKARKWRSAILGNGESWPRIFGSNIASSADFYRLGVIPTFVLTAPTTTSSGTSAAGDYGIVLVYRTSLFQDGLSGDDIQGNASNIVDVTLTATDAAVLTKVTSSDTKIDKLDIYAAIKVEGVYGAFYRVVKDGANSAGTITFNIQSFGGGLIGAGVTNGTLDDSLILLADDNDFPTAQPILLEVNGHLVSCGGIVKRVTATTVNGSSTITTAETIYDGINFWNFKVDGDTSGGIDGKGTYLVNYATANTMEIVDITGVSANYTGTGGTASASTFTDPNRKISKPLNPHSFPLDDINNDYPSAILAAGKVPNTNRVLLMGSNFVIAEDYDRLPITGGLNFISNEYGCASHFSIVSAQGRLWWLDFSGTKRKILTSDGSTVTPIATQKIQTILDRITLDENGDVWRVGFIHGVYYPDQETIRWSIYIDNNTVPNFQLELDIGAGNVIGDPQYYPLRYLDVFTYGLIRGRVYAGQFGWSGGIARLGIDNVQQRFRDWVGSSGTVSGSLDTTGQTASVFTVTGASFVTSGDGLKGIQVLIWRETDANSDLIADRTYYQCRISANTGTTLTVNYVEAMDVAGLVSSVSTQLSEVPSGSGWQFRVGVVQAIVGPKWFSDKDPRTGSTFRDITVIHKGQDISDTQKIVGLSFENLDNQPRAVEYLEIAQEGQQVADTDLAAASFGLPSTNPVTVHGFALHDNNVATDDTTGMDIEQIVLNYNEQNTQGG